MHKTERYEIVEGAIRKFWEVRLEGNAVTTREGVLTGKPKSDGKLTTVEHADARAAKRAYDAAIKDKRSAGYVAVNDDPPLLIAPRTKPRPIVRASIKEPINQVNADGKRVGRWVQNWDDSEDLFRDAIYVDGLLDGPFVQYHEDGVTPHVEGIFRPNRSHTDSLRVGPARFYHDNGVARMLCATDSDGNGSGTVLEFDEHGDLTEWYVVNLGEIVGAWRFYAQGRLVKERHVENGDVVGEKQWNDKGKLTVVAYEDGVPVLSPKQKSSLLAKLERGDEWAHLDVIKAAVSEEFLEGHLWKLVRDGDLLAGKMPALWPALADGEKWAKAADVARFLASVESTAAQHELLEGWPIDLDRLVLSVALREPALVDTNTKLPSKFALGIVAVRKRLGLPIPDRAQRELLAALVISYITRGKVEPVAHLIDGEIVMQARVGEDGVLSDEGRAFYSVFATPDEWDAALRDVAVEHAQQYCLYELARVEHLFANATAMALALLARRSHGIERAAQLRTDEPQVLLDAAVELAKRHDEAEAQQLALAAALAWARQGMPIPDAVDRFLKLNISDVAIAARALPALRAMPRPRVDRLVAASLAELQQARKQDQWLTPLSFVSVVSPEVIAVAEKLMTGNTRPDRSALYLATAGADGIDWLVAQRERSLHRDIYSAAIVHVLATIKPAPDEKYDVFLNFQIANATLAESIEHPLIETVRRLPPARADRVLARESAATQPFYIRAFECIGEASAATARLAWKTVVENLDALTGSANDLRIYRGLSGLGIGKELAREALTAGASKKLLRHLQDGIGRLSYEELVEELGSIVTSTAETLAERIVAQATKLSGPRCTIYVLEKHDAAPKPNELNRVGGTPIGVTDAAWPTVDAERLEHVFTIDLKQLAGSPLATRGRALSLFVERGADLGTVGNDRSRLIFSDDKTLKGKKATGDGACGFTVHAIEVPAAVFDEDEDEDEDEDAADLTELKRLIDSAPARLGGEPIWLQENPQHDGAFVMQLDASFADLNLGDMGVLYVYEDTAFFQCH